MGKSRGPALVGRVWFHHCVGHRTGDIINNHGFMSLPVAATADRGHTDSKWEVDIFLFACLLVIQYYQALSSVLISQHLPFSTNTMHSKKKWLNDSRWLVCVCSVFTLSLTLQCRWLALITPNWQVVAIRKTLRKQRRNLNRQWKIFREQIYLNMCWNNFVLKCL